MNTTSGVCLGRHTLISLFILFPFLAFAQGAFIPKGINELFRGQCPVCHAVPDDSNRVIGYADGFFQGEVDFHNCHYFCQHNDIDSAYHYSLLASEHLNRKEDSVRCKMATYIKAAILFHKQLYANTLDTLQWLYQQEVLSPQIRINVCTSIGAIYLIFDKYELSLQYLEDGMSRFKICEPRDLKNIYNTMALCYLFMKKKQEADLFFQKSLWAARQLNDTSGLAVTYINIANQYYNQYHDKEAAYYFNKGLQLALVTSNHNIKEVAYINLAMLAENKGDYHHSLYYRKKYEAQHDSLYDQDAVWNVAQQEKKLALQEKEHRIQLEQQKNKIQSLELEKQQQRLFITLLAAVLLLLFFIFMLSAYRTKYKQNRVITAQREELAVLNHTKDRLFSVVAHDLRSPVQGMKSVLIKLQAALAGADINSATTLSLQIDTLSGNIYSLLNNLLHWALSQTGQLRISLEKLHLRRLVEQVYFDYQIVAAAKMMVLENRIPDDLYCLGDLNSLKIVVRNLLDNAIKYSENRSVITMTAYASGEKCVLSIRNPGTGIDTEFIKRLLAGAQTSGPAVAGKTSRGTGLGLRLVKEMTEKNGGRLDIHNTEGGTLIQITLQTYFHHGHTENYDPGR